ncbi:hypothetical protein V495_04124 [Pseudogymnoascus sp. VKM F-4514 (FW-929)]|nr:hypothetical protein V495_04124 [Pseudogymnoascus sp. VKM F-4514 (FW-929)]
MERAETAKRKGWASDSTWSLVGSLSSSLNRTGQDETYADSDSGSPADAGEAGIYQALKPPARPRLLNWDVQTLRTPAIEQTHLANPSHSHGHSPPELAISPPTSHSNFELALALRTSHPHPHSHHHTDAFFLTFAGSGLPACLPLFALLFFPQYAGRRYIRTPISRPIILPILDNDARAATASAPAPPTAPPTPDLDVYTPLTALAGLHESLLDNDARAATASAPAPPTAPPTPDLDVYTPLTAPAGLHQSPEPHHRPAQQHLVELGVPGPPLAAAIPGIWRQPPELKLLATHTGPSTCTYAPTAPYSQAHSPQQNYSRQSYSVPQQALTYQPPPPQPLQPPHQQLHEQLHIKSETSDDTMTGRVKRERVAPAAGISEDVKPHLGASQGIEIKTKFPVARIKRIMQADEEVGKVAQVTPVAVSKALELFMISLVTKSASLARSTNSKRVTAVHLKKAIEADEQFDFLNDIVSKIADGPDAGQGKRTKEEEDGSDSDEKPKKKGRRKKGE